MNAEELKNDQRELNNSRDIIKDICQGDTDALKILDNKNLDMKAIKLAIDFLLKNPSLTMDEKADLLHESWRVNYRAKPPTPEEFITEKYLGPAANSTYQRVKDVFIDFMDPTKSYRDLILYPHIGWGKGLQYKELLHTPKGPIHVEDAKIGDEVCTPDGKIAHISNRKEWPDAPIYEVEFGDHRKVKVFGEHYWKAAYSYNNSVWNPVTKKYDIVEKTPCWKIITTEKLLEDIQAHPNHMWFIPITKPVHHDEKEHLISILKYIETIKIQQSPLDDEYKYDSIENRNMLLSALLNQNRFQSSNPKLLKDVAEVAYGLGKAVAYLNSTTIEVKDSPQVLHISSITPTSEKGGVCIETDDEEHLFLTSNYIVTHNSYLSAITTLYISTCVTLMRKPYKFFGLNPATQFSQFLMSYNLKKASELLLEPFNSILESSPFFEKVNRRETMQAREKEFEHMETVDKIYYTTAYPTSALGFSSGLTIKLASSPTAILGCTIISSVLSELAFFTDAGKALDMGERIRMADGSIKTMEEIQIGDELLSPTSKSTFVVNIPWQGKGDLYEIEVEDGRTVKCHANHLWPVTYIKDNKEVHENITTKFMFDHPEIEFDILSL